MKRFFSGKWLTEIKEKRDSYSFRNIILLRICKAQKGVLECVRKLQITTVLRSCLVTRTAKRHLSDAEIIRHVLLAVKC